MNANASFSSPMPNCAAWEGEGAIPRNLKMRTKHACKKPSPSSTTRQLGQICILMIIILFLRSLVILTSVTTPFGEGSNDLTRMHTWPTNHNNSSATFRNVLSLSGSSNSVTNQSPSPNEAYGGQYSSSPVVMSKQGRTGSRGSLSDILPLNLQSPVAWTRSVQSASIGNQFEITSPYSKRSLTSWRYLGKMSGIWMRKVVSVEGDGKDLQKSTSFPKINDLHTGKRVEILSLSQLLSVSMPLVIQSNLGSSFLGSSITENGWLLTQKFRKLQKRTQIVRY